MKIVDRWQKLWLHSWSQRLDLFLSYCNLLSPIRFNNSEIIHFSLLALLKWKWILFFAYNSSMQDGKLLMFNWFTWGKLQDLATSSHWSPTKFGVQTFYKFFFWDGRLRIERQGWFHSFSNATITVEFIWEQFVDEACIGWWSVSMQDSVAIQNSENHP